MLTRFPHEAGCVDPWQSTLASEWEAFLVQTKEKVQMCMRLHYKCPPECSQLCQHRKGKKGISGLSDAFVPYHLGPQRATESTNFLISLKRMMSTSVCEKAPKQRRNLKPKTQHSPSCYTMLCNINIGVSLWRNSTLSKIRKRLQNMLNFWPREWRWPKRKTGNRLPRDGECLLWELLSTVKNEMF